jgi:hypothetical protein
MPEPPAVPPDPWSRLRHVLAIEHLDPPGDPVLLETESNDAWRIGDLVVRVCWRGDRARLQREMLVATHLPEGIPYPTIISGGRDEVLSWTVTRRLPGVALSDLWDSLPIDQRRAAIRQHAQTLKTLHAWQPPPRVSEALRQRPPVDPNDPATIVGADVNPLPLSRAMLLVQSAKRLPFVDPGVIDALAATFQELRTLDPFLTDELVVVHGDAGTTNVLWHDARLIALVDFEWVRWGPRDLELAPFIGFMGGRSLLLSWLEDDYPQLFGHPRIIERLWLYELAGALRGLIVWPPRSPEDPQRPYSALWELRKALEGPAHIIQLLGR